MPLADVRELFLELSGRHDLLSEGTVTGVYTNSALTTPYASRGIVGTTLYLKMDDATAAMFRRNQQVILRVPSDNELDVLAKVYTITLNGDDSYLMVKLLEKDDNSTVYDLSDCTIIANTKQVNIDWYINKGQKLLDRMLTERKGISRYPVNLTLGQVFVPIYQCRVVKNVWAGDASEKWKLERIDYETIKGYYGEPKENIASGYPAFYAPVTVRSYPRALTLSTLNQDWMLDDLISSNSESYNGIAIYPPCDSATYMAEIEGVFYSEPLVKNGDKSFWSEEHDIVLAMAALYYVEVTYRNTKGAKDWMNSVQLDLDGIVKDSIEEEIEGMDHMEG